MYHVLLIIIRLINHSNNLFIILLNNVGNLNHLKITIHFSEWFHNNFVTTTQARLKEMKQTPKALLLLENCSAHPDESELIPQDGLL